MSQTVTASKANQSFSELLREVQQGQEFVVTSRGRPIARLVPYSDAGSKTDLLDMLKRFEQEPRRYLPNWKRADLYE